jgi:hypothetical protein
MSRLVTMTVERARSIHHPKKGHFSPFLFSLPNSTFAVPRGEGTLLPCPPLENRSAWCLSLDVAHESWLAPALPQGTYPLLLYFPPHPYFPEGDTEAKRTVTKRGPRMEKMCTIH